MTRVAIIGGGIAGLSAAFTLRQHGVDVTVFEASSRLGGKIHTERVNGLLIDAGPDSFLSSKPAALALATELGLGDRIINTLHDGGGTFILRAGELQPLPEGITLLVPAEMKAIAETPLLSPLGKARMALDYVIPAKKDDGDESVGSFVRRRLGKQAFERMAEPLLSGIFAGDADQLSLQSTFPRLRQVEREHGSVIKGAIVQRRAARARTTATEPKRTPFVSLRNGLGSLIDALADTIEPLNIRLSTPVELIEPSADGYAVVAAEERIDFDGVVVAVPANVAAVMLRSLDQELTVNLASVPFVSSAAISLAFDADAVRDKQVGRGFVIPRAEGRTLTAVTWTSNKFVGRVPDDIALLRGFVGRAGNERPAFLPEEELIPLVRAELKDILGIDAKPLTSRVYRWPNALPQYNLGHPERLAEIERCVSRHPGLALTGASYRGVGIPDCIADARTQSTALVERLRVQSMQHVRTTGS